MGPVPDLRGCALSERSTGLGRSWHLKVVVEEGDLFVLNTRAWFHRTELEEGGGGGGDGDWSISAARDFFLPPATPPPVSRGASGHEEEEEEEEVEDGNVEGEGEAAHVAAASPPLRCTCDAERGDVVLEEEALPEDLSCLARSRDPNCSLAQVEYQDCRDEEGLGIALVALRDVAKGEVLTIEHEEEEEEEEEEEDDDDDDDGDGDGGDRGKHNSNASIDPRAVAQRDYRPGEPVLAGADIPEDLPRSLEPTCELRGGGGGGSSELDDDDDDDDDDDVVVAIGHLSRGEIISIAPSASETYREVEVDLASSEIV